MTDLTERTWTDADAMREARTMFSRCQHNRQGYRYSRWACHDCDAFIDEMDPNA